MKPLPAPACLPACSLRLSSQPRVRVRANASIRVHTHAYIHALHCMRTGSSVSWIILRTFSVALRVKNSTIADAESFALLPAPLPAPPPPLPALVREDGKMLMTTSAQAGREGKPDKQAANTNRRQDRCAGRRTERERGGVKNIIVCFFACDCLFWFERL